MGFRHAKGINTDLKKPEDGPENKPAEPDSNFQKLVELTEKITEDLKGKKTASKKKVTKKVSKKTTAKKKPTVKKEPKSKETKVDVKTKSGE